MVALAEVLHPCSDGYLASSFSGGGQEVSPPKEEVEPFR